MPAEQSIGEILASFGLNHNCLWMMDLAEVQKYALARKSPQVSHRNQAPTATTPQPETQPGIAVIDVKGVLMPEAEWSDEVDSGMLASLLSAMEASEQVEAVVLNIDSPGGASMGMTDLAAAAGSLAAAKPLFSFSQFIMCSGAYWLGAPSQKIFAGSDAIIGSIGTRQFLLDGSKLFENMGLEAVAIDTGEFKSMGAFGTQLSESHRQFLQDRVNLIQENFSAGVQTGRGFTDDQLAAVADGRFFLPSQALELGLIDGVSTLAQTIAAAADAVASSQPSTRTKTMSDPTPPAAPQAPQPATLAELKRAMPESSAEFREEQIEAEATLSDALSAYNTHLAAENKKLGEEKAAAEQRATEAEEKSAAATPPPETGKKRGNATQAAGGDATDPDVNYHQMAREYQEKHKCRWSEATHEIKRRHPEAQQVFGVPEPVS